MRYFPAIALLATLAACAPADNMASADAETTNTDPTAQTAVDDTGTANPATPTDAASYVTMAGASDLYEIQSSQLALQKAASDDVRRFAQMMVTDHTKTTQQVTAAARAAGMTPPPPALQPMQAQMMSQLQPLTGAAFDAAYLDQQRTAHDMALALHRNYADNGDTAQLRQVASTAVPIIEHHIEELQGMPSS